MSEEPHLPWIEPELEARIVALVLGEASDFERAELERLIEERPELATFRKRIVTTHGQLSDLAKGEAAADDDHWKLSDEKRSAVLAVLDTETSEQPLGERAHAAAEKPVEKLLETRDARRGRFLWNLSRIAAVLCVVGLIGALSLPLTVTLTANNRNGLKNFTLAPGQAAGVHEGAPVVDRFEDAGSLATSRENSDNTPIIGFAERDYGADSKSSLLAIRGSLDSYSATLTRGENGRERPSSGNAGRPLGTSERPGTNGGESPAEVERSVTESDAALDLIFSTEESESFDSEADADDMLADPFGSEIPAGGTGGENAQENRGLSEGTGQQNASGSMPAGDGYGGEGGGYGMEGGYGGGYGGGFGGGGMGGFGLGERGYAGTESEKGFDAGDVREREESPPAPTVGPTSFDFYSKRSEKREAAAGTQATPVEVDRELQMMVTPGIIIEKEAEVPTPSDRSGSDHNWAFQNSPQLGEEANIWSRSGARRAPAGAPIASEFKAATPGTDTRMMESLGKSTESPSLQLGINSDGVSSWDATADGDGLERSLQRGQRSTSGIEPPEAELATKNLSSSTGTAFQPRGEISRPASKSPVPRFDIPAGLDEKSAQDEAFSTFSLHVSDVSFKLAQAALAQGQWPDAATVRIEEFVNAFDYGDPMPSQSEKVSCRLEQAIHPFLQQRNLLRVSMRTAATGRSGDTPLRLTFLLDNSGSMERIDRQQTVRRAFALLAAQLKPIDQVTLISFARQPRLLADKVSGAEAQQLVQLVHDLPSEGGTNLEAALQLAFEKAREQQIDQAQNRIIMLTDGAANLGDADPASLAQAVERIRSAGIAFDAAGISAAGLNDEILEALTRKGDGRYYLLDQPENVDDGFSRQIAGALRPAAMNVKVQIEFNPRRVGRYKLLGFEKHRLKKKEFRDDTVDAAEMAPAEAGVALYQFEAKPDGEGDVGSVSVRFRDMSTGEMVENRWPIPYEADTPRLEQAAPSLRIATSAALLAAKLRGGPMGESVDLRTLSNLLAGLPHHDRTTKRVQQLQQMIQQARQIEGN